MCDSSSSFQAPNPNAIDVISTAIDSREDDPTAAIIERLKQEKRASKAALKLQQSSSSSSDTAANRTMHLPIPSSPQSEVASSPPPPPDIIAQLEAMKATIETHQRTLASNYNSSYNSSADIDPRFRRTPTDIQELDMTRNDSTGALQSYFVTVQRVFNDAFLFTQVFFTGKIQTTEGNAATAVAMVSNLTDGIFGGIPFAGAVLGIAGAMASKVCACLLAILQILNFTYSIPL